jgi:hypothetical protein
LETEGYFQTADYRRAGARGRPGRLVYDPARYQTPEAAKAALEADLGTLLAMFRVLPADPIDTSAPAACDTSPTGDAAADAIVPDKRRRR